MIFEDPVGDGQPIELERFGVPKDVPDRDQRIGKIPPPDPHYIDLGMLYRFAQVEAVRRAQPEGFSPLHLAVRATWVPARITTSSNSRRGWGSRTTGFP